MNVFALQVDGVRERLSEQQYHRLVDYIAKTSCHLVPSCSFMQTPCPVVAVEPPSSTVKAYHYLVDPHFAQVFVSKFTMVKNKALRKGFPWTSSKVWLSNYAVFGNKQPSVTLTFNMDTEGQHFYSYNFLATYELFLHLSQSKLCTRWTKETIVLSILYLICFPRKQHNLMYAVFWPEMHSFCSLMSNFHTTDVNALQQNTVSP